MCKPLARASQKEKRQKDSLSPGKPLLNRADPHRPATASAVDTGSPPTRAPPLFGTQGSTKGDGNVLRTSRAPGFGSSPVTAQFESHRPAALHDYGIPGIYAHRKIMLLALI